MASDSPTIAAPGPALGRRAAAADDAVTAYAVRACFVIMFAALFLQRFAIPLGEAKVHIASVVAIPVVLWGVATGKVRLHLMSFAGFVLLLALVLGAALIDTQVVLRSGVRFSLTSMVHFLGLFALMTFRFARPVSQLRIFGVYQNLMLVIVLCGFAQFALQFVGFELFTFIPYVPIDYLVEPLFNGVIPISGNSGPYKANGMFLVEPSLFSQTSAVSIAIEATCFRRIRRLLLLFGGMLIAVSGTGMIVLAVFGVIFLSNPRNARPSEILGLALAVALAALAVWLVFPEIFERMLSRVDEFEAEGSSGHIRFTSIITGITYAYERFPDYLLWGVGPGSAEALAGERVIGINTLTKVAIEYGLPAFCVWFVYHVAAAWHRHLAVVVLPVLVFFWTGGNYQQFGPAICLVLALLVLNPDRSLAPVHRA
jgi:hypothetical protein